jgi:antitoxin YefM
MAVVGIRKLANELSKHIELVEKTGEPVVITRHGKPIAAMQALDQERLEALVLATAPQFVEDLEQADRELAEGTTRSTDAVRAELGLDPEVELPLVGETVLNEAGEEIGEIADVIISGRTGMIEYALMDFVDKSGDFIDVIPVTFEQKSAMRARSARGVRHTKNPDARWGKAFVYEKSGSELKVDEKGRPTLLRYNT